MWNARLKFLGACLLVLCATLALDRFIYDYLIFTPENRTGWDSYRWYNFEYHLRRLERDYKDHRTRRANGDKLVLIVGSSIAKYSVQSAMLEDRLKARGLKNVRVEILTHASMIPTDLKYYLPRIQSLGADLVVYITNPADLDLERFSPPWETAPEYLNQAEEAFLKGRLPMLTYYPGPFAADRPGIIGVQERLRLFTRNFFTALRFKDRWFAPVSYNLNGYRRPVLKSYLYYQGEPGHTLLWREGLTGACFAFPRDYITQDFQPPISKFHFQRPTPLGFTSDFRLRFYSYKNTKQTRPDLARGPMARDFSAVTAPLSSCKLPENAKLILDHRSPATGWQNAPLPLRNIRPGDDSIFLRLSHVVSLDKKKKLIELKDEVDYPITLGQGIRLPGNFGLKRYLFDDYLVRRPSLEDLRLFNLNQDEYIKDYTRRIQPDNWGEPENIAMHQFNRLRLAKYYTNWYDFKPVYQARELREITKVFNQPDVNSSGFPTRILIVNNPENPLSLAEYEHSVWYSGYLDFMQSLAAGPGVRFRDLHNQAPFNLFVDAHHLTYKGVEFMAPRYAALIEENLINGINNKNE